MNFPIDPDKSSEDADSSIPHVPNDAVRESVNVAAPHSTVPAIRWRLRAQSWFHWLCLGVILAIGFSLRLDGIQRGAAFAFNYASQGDSVEAYEVAVNYAMGEPRAQYIGQPNFNSHSKLPGPLWAAFCLAGLQLFGTIKGTATLVLLSGTAAIFLTYLLATKTVGPHAGLFAALFQATSPSAVHFSVVVFNPAIMPFLGALLVLALWRVTQRDGSHAIIWVVVLLLVMPQIHLSGLLLMPAVVLAIWLSRRTVSLGWLMAGLVLGSCCYLPYLTGESAHGWQNSRGMIDGGPIRYAAGTLEAFVAPVSFLLNYWAPKWAYTAAEYRELSRVTFGGPGEAVATNVLSTMVALFLTVGGILASSEGLRGFWRSPRQVFAASPGIVFLSVIFVVPLAASVLVGQPFHPRYALVLLAPLFALAGAGALRWFRHERFGRLFTTLLCVAVAANIWFMPRMFRFQDRLIETSARFIPSFYNLELVYQALVHHAGDHRVVALSDEAYLLGLTPKDDRWLRGAALLRRYINVRNLEQGLPRDRVSRASYILRRESDVETGAADVAYRGNGIAIVASPLPPP